MLVRNSLCIQIDSASINLDRCRHKCCRAFTVPINVLRKALIADIHLPHRRPLIPEILRLFQDLDRWRDGRLVDGCACFLQVMPNQRISAGVAAAVRHPDGLTAP